MIAKDPKKAPEWMLEGLCRLPENSGVVFVPNKGQSTAAAKRICAGCEVRSECLDYAIVFDMEGIWGGTTTGWRERMFPPATREIVRDDYYAA